MALPAYLVLVFGNWEKVFFSVYILSFLFSFLTPNVQDVTDTLSQTEIGANSAKGYLVEEQSSLNDNLERAQSSGSNWYKAYTKARIAKYADFLIIILIFFTGTYTKNMNKVEASLFSTGLLTLTLSNVSWFYFALQNRTAVVGVVFIFAALLLTWQNPNRQTDTMFFKSKLVSFALSISLILYIPSLVLKISMLLGFISFFFLITPFITWIVPEVNMSIIEFIKWLI
jgi:hypothetical protein